MAGAGKSCATCGGSYEPDVLFCPKDGTPLGTAGTRQGDDPYVGLELLGQIAVEQCIGVGSMGRVYRAFQAGIERNVAVKILHRELSANTTLVGRFHREAKVASRLVHPNVVQVLMAGQLKDTIPAAEGALYLVMEFLDGISLLSALAASGDAMPLPRALHIILQVCDAVGEAHAQGIVHRDLKPENVMLVRRGDDHDYVKVLDFGIARLDWGDSPAATQAGLIFGTARYISPEGAAGERVGPAADVYAIATMLYQCLAGRTPFDGDSPVALLVHHTHEAPPPVTSIPRASYLPSPLASAIMKNLAKKPEERDPDARSFGRALVDAARASGLSPDDLIPRSTLLGQRAASRAVSLSSIERTKQLELSPSVAAQIGAWSPKTKATGTEPGALADSENVDRTIVDAPPSDAPVPTPPPAPVSSPLPALDRPSAPSVLTPPPSQAPVSQPIRPVPSSAGGALSSDRTLDDDDLAIVPASRGHARAGLFIAACFLGGAGLAAFGAYRWGLVGPSARPLPAPPDAPPPVVEVIVPPPSFSVPDPIQPPSHASARAGLPAPRASAAQAGAAPRGSSAAIALPDAGAPAPSTSSGGRWL